MVRVKYHSLIYVPIAGSQVSRLPVILLPDGSRFFEALHWTIERFKHGLSNATLKKQTQSIGNFVDFFYGYKNNPKVMQDTLQVLVEEFSALRISGCEALGWTAITPSVAQSELEYLSMFFDHCSDSFGYLPVNVAQEVSEKHLSYRDHLGNSKGLWLRREGLLGHLWESHKTKRKYATRPIKLLKKLPTDGNTFKSFPPLHVANLLESCHSIRDVLVFILLFYGGVRSSEICHILVQDVCSFPDPKTGEAIVTLAHPEFGWIDYDRKSDGKPRKSVQRQVYLREEYGLVPRNKLPVSSSLHAGWKGMVYEGKGYLSTVYWSRPDMGILFYALHRRYMDLRAVVERSHPYYFINIDASRSRTNYGKPLKIKSLRDRFYDACIRIGLTPGRANGINPHGARHFYGYFLANILRISKERTQRFLRHASIQSTDIYYALSAATARDELMIAFERAKSGADHLLNQKIELKEDQWLTS